MADRPSGEDEMVPLEVVTTLGRIVLMAGHVEAVLHDMLLDLGQDPSRLSLRKAVKRLRELVPFGLPSHAGATPAEISLWCEQLLSAMDQRDRKFHAVTFGRMAEAGHLVPVSTHLRSGDEAQVDAASLEQLLAKFVRLMQQGHDLHTGLLRSPREGIFLRNWYREGEPWAMVVQAGPGEPVPKRPTDDELQAWWDKFGPGLFLDPREPGGPATGS
jgi:hypothetical protein